MNMAVVPPMPSASVRMAAAVNTRRLPELAHGVPEIAKEVGHDWNLRRNRSGRTVACGHSPFAMC